MLPLITALVSVVTTVSGHGGMIWPPIWQDGHNIPLEERTDALVYSEPMVQDPSTGRDINKIKTWLTDQVFLEGRGEEYRGVGIVTNPECKSRKCKVMKTPWASPGSAPSLGGGCGIFGGNPDGCPAGNDTRSPIGGPKCTPVRGVFAFGSSALDISFPQAITTEWELGSWQDVAWVSRGSHWGGYTYRLCKLPQEGKSGITEECFAQNVLQFATPFTMLRNLETTGNWEKFNQVDLTEGTYPEGSAWRHVGKTSKQQPGYLRKDQVIVPADLAEGEYVLSFRWDTKAPQIWVSCSNIRLVLPTSIYHATALPRVLT